MDDAAMFSGWVQENNYPNVNGQQMSDTMYGKSMFEWIWENRRHCNDWIKAQH